MSSVSVPSQRGEGFVVNRWWQLVAAVVAMMAIANLQYAWTLFTGPLTKSLNAPLAAVQVAFAAFVLAETWLVPFEGALVDKFGQRAIIMVGGLLVGARGIRALEQDGVIQGYQARINREAIGLGMTVIVHVGLNSQSEEVLKAFEAAVARAPSVVSCRLMSGEDDYLVTVMARDLADYERIHKEQLSRLPGVARLKSSFVLREVTSRPLPASCLLP